MHKEPARSALALAFAFTLLGTSTQAATYSSGHGDIGIGYEGGELEPHWHIHAGGTVEGQVLTDDAEYEPENATALITSTSPAPTGSDSGLGVSPGTSIWKAGSATFQPNLGFAAEELVVSEWDGDISMTLTGFTMPSGGQAAVYLTNLNGNSISDYVFSTFDKSATTFGNTLDLTPGSHSHYEFGFTQPGTYQMTFEFSGNHVTDGAKTSVGTFGFQVVPEPGVFGLAGLALLPLLRRRR